MNAAGAAETIADQELSAELLGAAVRRLFADPKRLAAMAAASATLARPDAARRIATEVMAAIR